MGVVIEVSYWLCCQKPVLRISKRENLNRITFNKLKLYFKMMNWCLCLHFHVSSFDFHKVESILCWYFFLFHKSFFSWNKFLSYLGSAQVCILECKEYSYYVTILVTWCFAFLTKVFFGEICSRLFWNEYL